MIQNPKLQLYSRNSLRKHKFQYIRLLLKHPVDTYGYGVKYQMTHHTISINSLLILEIIEFHKQLVTWFSHAFSRCFFPGEFNEFKLTSRAKGWCDNCCTPRRSRDLHFVVYNKSNQKDGVEVAPHFKAGAARAAGVDSKLPTVIFIHGFSETSPGGSGRAIVDGNYSLVIVNQIRPPNVERGRTLVFMGVTSNILGYKHSLWKIVFI